MKKRKAAAILAALSMLATALLGGCNGNEASTTTAQDGETTASADAAPEASAEDEALEAELKAMNALELSIKLGNGINLGNTMEAYNHSGYLAGQDPTGFENLWGQPRTTQEMIDDMKEMGFDTLRIPVAWTNGMNYESGDYTIDERLLNRVEEIVNYALNADMYVIVNEHWDGGWWGMFGSEDMAVREKAMDIYKAMWTQIGERFKDYSYRLIFESANEELCTRLNDSDITGSKGVLTTPECYEMTHTINSEFVKLIRSQGGKNEDRFLLIAGFNTDIKQTCDDKYIMPDDTANGKLFISVHYYTPWDYCGTDALNSWGSPIDYEEQNGLLEMMTKFTDNGYGVIIGEYAVMKKNGGIKPETDKFYRNFLYNCDYYNYCPVLWDCSNLYKRNSGIVADEACGKLFDEKRQANEPEDYEQVKSTAKAAIDAAYAKAEEEMSASVSVPASDDYAVAWIMYNSSDWGLAYSAGDTYDPTNKTAGIKDRNVKIEGEGTYTIGLDFTECGGAKGVAFSAIGISHGEEMYPGYSITVDEILINGEPFAIEGKNYTSSDDGKCTRTNLYNQWVNTIPDEARTADGNLDGASAQIMNLGKDKVDTIEVTFTYTAPKA